MATIATPLLTTHSGISLKEANFHAAVTVAPGNPIQGLFNR